MTPLSLVVGMQGIFKHAAKDFRKGWEMAKAGVIQPHLGNALAKGKYYRQRAGLRKIPVSAYDLPASY